MRKVKSISKATLNTLYPNGQVTVFDNALSYNRYKLVNVSSLPDPLIVDRNTTAMSIGAPYQMVRMLKQSSEYKFLLGPNQLEDTAVPELVDLVTPVLDELMPGRYTIVQRDNGTYDVYLYYPELEMTNKVGGKHTIYDMVVRFNIFDDVVTGGLYGMRFSYSQDELQRGYSHSHLPTHYHEGFNAFCLGKTNLSTTMRTGRVNDADMFAMFILQIEAYLKWESLEGSPYISFDTLHTVQNHTVDAPVSNNELVLMKEMAKRFIRELTPDLLFRAANNRYLLNLSESSKLFEIECKVAEEFEPIHRYLVAYDADSKFYIRPTVELPDLSEEAEDLVDKFNINRRVLVSEVKEVGKVVRRLTQLQLYWLFNFINSYLSYGCLTNEENHITT